MSMMLKKSMVGALILMQAAWLAACGRPAPVPLLFGAAPWQSGEQHAYTVTDVDGKPAGAAEFTVKQAVNEQGEPIWVIERSTTTQGDQETVTVKVSEKGFRPESSYLTRSSAAGTETVEAKYTSGTVDMTLNTRQNVMSVQRAQVPSDVRETAVLPLLARALPLASGYATAVNAYLPVAGLLDRVNVSVTGEENVTVPAGAYKAWVVELDTGSSKSKLWISQAAPYPLVKFIDGRSKATYDLNAFRASS